MGTGAGGRRQRSPLDIGGLLHSCQPPHRHRHRTSTGARTSPGARTRPGTGAIPPRRPRVPAPPHHEAPVQPPPVLRIIGPFITTRWHRLDVAGGLAVPPGGGLAKVSISRRSTELFGDLDRVQSGAFSEVVPHRPQVDATGCAERPPNPTHQHFVPAGAVERSRDAVKPQLGTGGVGQEGDRLGLVPWAGRRSGWRRCHGQP